VRSSILPSRSPNLEVSRNGESHTNRCTGGRDDVLTIGEVTCAAPVIVAVRLTTVLAQRAEDSAGRATTQILPVAFGPKAAPRYSPTNAI